MPENNDILSYKGRMLRRKDNVLYFGTMAEQYIIMLQILSTKTINDLNVADKVAVRLERTDPTLSDRDRVVKKTEKGDLYTALDVASVWLDRATSPA